MLTIFKTLLIIYFRPLYCVDIIELTYIFKKIKLIIDHQMFGNNIFFIYFRILSHSFESTNSHPNIFRGINPKLTSTS